MLNPLSWYTKSTQVSKNLIEKLSETLHIARTWETYFLKPVNKLDYSRKNQTQWKVLPFPFYITIHKKMKFLKTFCNLDNKFAFEMY